MRGDVATAKERMGPGLAVVIMGVSGCGKTTVGKMLAKAVGGKFVDGDDLHGVANREKMARGESLTDDDRMPWLARCAGVLTQPPSPTVVACSALKRSYRDHLRGAVSETGTQTLVFLWLRIDCRTAIERVRSREGHFMPESLVASQFEALEDPETGKEPDVLAVDGSLPPGQLLEQSQQRLEAFLHPDRDRPGEGPKSGLERN